MQGTFSLPARVRAAEVRMELATRQLQGRSAEYKKVSQYQIALEISEPFSEVDPQFLSVMIGARYVSRNWSGNTFTAQRIINMARGLTPAMLRVGGTSGDFLIFNSSTSDLAVMNSLHHRCTRFLSRIKICEQKSSHVSTCREGGQLHNDSTAVG